MRQTAALMLAALAATVLLTPAALAQAPTCAALQQELAALDRSGGGGAGARRFEQAAQRQSYELQRTIAYSRQIGCGNQRFLIFGSDPPAECRTLNAQIGQMRANLDGLNAQASRAGGGPGREARRQQLIGAINRYCAVAQARPRGLIEQLFGGEERRAQEFPPEDMLDGPPPEERGPRLGGGKAVCVRTCDGFFFPLATSGGRGRNSANDMCQALCPGTETALYFLDGKGELEGAVGADGTPYTSLPNALKYTREVDSTCACRRPGETWAQALRDAEEMLGARRGDVIVTEEKSAEMAKPAPAVDPRRDVRRGRNAPAAVPASVVQPVVVDGLDASALDAARGQSAPTAGSESSGIGARDSAGSRLITRSEGQRLELTGAGGEKRSVRIVGPPALAGATAQP